MMTKMVLIQDKILPYFKDMKMNEITVAHITQWQNELLAYRDKMCIRDSPSPALAKSNNKL